MDMEMDMDMDMAFECGTTAHGPDARRRAGENDPDAVGSRGRAAAAPVCVAVCGAPRRRRGGATRAHTAHTGHAHGRAARRFFFHTCLETV